MSKKQHEKELARARARRETGKHIQQNRTRVGFALLGAVVAVAVVLGVMWFVGRDDPDPTPTPSSSPSEPATATPGDDPTGSPGGEPTAQPSTTASPVAAPCPAPTAAPTPNTSMTFTQVPPADDVPDSIIATIDTTCGPIIVSLNGAEAPQAVASFLFLAEQGFYRGTPFHRVMSDFVIQGGDPTGTGGGGPGYQFEDELALAEQLVADNDGLYPRGTLAMANSGPDTNGSQFFIVQGDPGYRFPPDYVVFGEVIEGMDVVDDIANGPVTGPRDDLAVDPAIIEEVRIDSP